LAKLQRNNTNSEQVDILYSLHVRNKTKQFKLVSDVSRGIRPDYEYHETTKLQMV